jgi:hypothetical protein
MNSANGNGTWLTFSAVSKLTITTRCLWVARSVLPILPLTGSREFALIATGSIPI